MRRFEINRIQSKIYFQNVITVRSQFFYFIFLLFPFIVMRKTIKNFLEGWRQQGVFIFQLVNSSNRWSLKCSSNWVIQILCDSVSSPPISYSTWQWELLFSLECEIFTSNRTPNWLNFLRIHSQLTCDYILCIDVWCTFDIQISAITFK